MSQLPSLPWDRYDETLRLLGRREELPPVLGEALKFLEAVSLVEISGGVPSLSDRGRAYFHSRHVTGEVDDAARLVKACLMDLPSARLICQVFSGRGAVTRVQVENLLCQHQVIGTDSGESALGTYLEMLNRFGIVAYSKKHGTVRVLETGRALDKDSLPRQVFLDPETPFGNLRRVKELLSACEGNVYWVDKHFDRKALVLVADAVDCSKVPLFTIVSSRANVNQAAETELGLLRAELAAKGTTLQWIVLELSQMRTVHDRWVAWHGRAYNLPPVNSIFGGQAAEITASDAPHKVLELAKRLAERGQELP